MDDFKRVARVIDYMTQHRRDQPSLEELAKIVDLSPAHFQRLFLRWAGVSPKKSLQLLTVSAVRQRLKDGQSVLEAALDEGLSGPGRLHDLTVSIEAASPGEIKAGGEGWQITAGYTNSPFGDCLIAATPRGICQLDFVENRDRNGVEEELLADWPKAEIYWDDSDADTIGNRIFQQKGGTKNGLRCFIKGSQFQICVWRALLRIPAGHRVIRKTGIVGQYRWGEVRKQAVIARELSQTEF